MNTIIGKSNFYARHGIDTRYVRNLGHVLGLPMSTHYFALVAIAQTLKMKM